MIECIRNTELKKKCALNFILFQTPTVELIQKQMQLWLNSPDFHEKLKG